MNKYIKKRHLGRNSTPENAKRSSHTSNFARTKTSSASRCLPKRPYRPTRPRWWPQTSTPLLLESWWGARGHSGRGKCRKTIPEASLRAAWWGMEVEEETGKPKTRHAAFGGGQRQQSTQEFIRRGNNLGRDDGSRDGIFSTPGKQTLRGAFARSFSPAASSPQQVGMAQTLNSAKSSRCQRRSCGNGKNSRERRLRCGAAGVVFPCHCSFLRRTSWRPQERSRGRTDAESMAMSFASRHLIWLLRGLQQLRQHTSYGVATDSQGALELAKNHRINNRSKHVDTH